MREIKFRAWDKAAKRMLTWHEDEELIKDAIPWCCGDEWTENCILMQYVGFRDKNGVEIYEGDIVKVKKHYEGDNFVKEFIGEIVMDEGYWWVENLSRPDFGCDVWNYVKNYCGGKVGNKFENPELLSQRERNKQ